MNEQQQIATVPASHPALAGHFPGRPIVPGVVIIECVLTAVRPSEGQQLAAIPNVKFVQPLAPDQPFRIFWTQHGETVRFRCESDHGLLAQGTLLLRGDPG